MQTDTLFLKGRKKNKMKRRDKKSSKTLNKQLCVSCCAYVANDSFGLDCSDAVQLAASVSGLVGRNWKSSYNGLQAFGSS